jgi:Type IV secretion-system coupling protein DNA-binding domain
MRVFKREFDAFWGPRMEDAFRFGLMALFEANEAICHMDPNAGRSAQHTVLEVPDLLGIPRFRNSVLKRTSDPAIKHWFTSYFDPLELRHRQEIINPVQTKVHKYAGSKIARAIVGQPRSTIDFRELIAQDRIVVINLHAFDVIEDTAALIGGTLLNLAARAVSSQSSLVPERRRKVTMAVDEFHTIPGADYEQVFGELAKYGANMILATQTLARLDRLTEADRTRDLRAAVFSNLDGLFAFHTSAEDAEYLAEELGGGLNKQDLLEFGQYQCYARLTDVRTGERLPAFSVRLDAPPVGDTVVAERLAAASAERYGRNVVDVELDLQTAAERIRHSNAMQQTEQENPASGGSATGSPSSARTPAGGQVPRPRRANASRKTGTRPSRKRGASEPHVGVEGGEREKPAA